MEVFKECDFFFVGFEFVWILRLFRKLFFWDLSECLMVG